jgi:sugar lactone lactonase YvrE
MENFMRLFKTTSLLCMFLFSFTALVSHNAWSQIITTAVGVAGGGYLDGPATLARFSDPDAIAFDSHGNMYIADAGNGIIRRVDAATSMVSTYAGVTIGVFYGDGGPATWAGFNYPSGLAFDAQDNLYISDYYDNRIRRVDAVTGIITTVVGSGPPYQGMFAGDGGPATLARINCPVDITFDAQGNMYFADTENNRVRRVDAVTGIITTVAGNGVQTYAGDGGPATSASLFLPQSVAFDLAGNLLISDSGNNVFRRVDAVTGIITTFAGTGVQNYSGDGGPATAATFHFDNGNLLVDSVGNIFMTDDWNHVVRRIDAVTGIITTIAGNGTLGYSGDGGPATSAQFNHTEDTVFDNSGNMYIIDFSNAVIRRVSMAAIIFTPTVTDTPTITPTATITATPTPVPPDIFYVSENAYRPGQGSSVSIFVQYPFPGEYSLKVYNSAGEQITTLIPVTVLQAPMSQATTWNGKNISGEDCASGMYLFYLTEPFDRKLKRMLLLR